MLVGRWYLAQRKMDEIGEGTSRQSEGEQRAVKATKGISRKSEKGMRTALRESDVKTRHPMGVWPRQQSREYMNMTRLAGSLTWGGCHDPWGHSRTKMVYAVCMHEIVYSLKCPP